MTGNLSQLRLSHRLLVVFIVAIGLALPFTVTRFPAALVLICVMPAAPWLLRHSPFAARPGGSGTPASPGDDGGLVSTVALTWVLSSIVFGLVTLLMMWFGAPSDWAAACTAVAVAVLFLAFGGGPVPNTDDPERRVWWGLLAVIAVAALVAFWLPVSNSWWRFREDSWFHAAVFHRVANHGLPLVDPYFSPLRLQYMYFYHVLLIDAARFTRLDPFHAMIFTNAIALVGCGLGLYTLAAEFCRRPAARLAAVVLGLFSMNGLFYVFFPLRAARAFVGESRGTDQLKDLFTLSPPGHESAAEFLSIMGNQFLFIDKFMVGTALSLTLGAVCIVLALLVRAVRSRGDWRAAALLGALVAGTILLHLVIGATVWFATAVAALLLTRRTDTRPLLLVLALAALITAPYVYSVIPRGEGDGSVRVAIQARHVVGSVAAVLAVLIPALVYLRRPSVERTESSEPDRGRQALVVWVVAAAVACLLIDLPTTNESKFTFPLFLALAGLAAGGLDRWFARGRGTAVWVYVALATVPLHVIYFYGAFRDPSMLVTTDDESAVYEWISRSTSKDAVFLEQFDIVRIPVLAQRDQYWGTETYARNWGYPADALNARRVLRDKIFSDGSVTADDLTPVADLGRPFYVVCRLRQSENRPVFDKLVNSPLFSSAYVTEEIALFRVNTE